MTTHRTSPWAGRDRATYVEKAAQRSFVLGDVPDLQRLPELFTDPCPRSLYVSAEDVGRRSGRELHVIGVYEAASVLPKTEDRQPRPVEVRLRKTAHPVVLLLMSYDPVEWQIAVDPDACLRGVILSSYHESTVRCAVALHHVVPLQNGPHAYALHSTEPGECDGLALIELFERHAGLPVASFQGEYAGTRFQVPCYDDATIVRDVLARHQALVRERTVTPPAPFLLVDAGFIIHHGTRDEPISVPAHDTKAVTFCDANGRYYAIADQALYAVAPDGTSDAVAPANAPRLGWLGGVTYDAKRRRVVVTTCWHTGAHYLYDPTSGRWDAIDVAQTGGGIHAIAYDRVRDVHFALAGGLLGPPELIVLTPDLRPLRRLECTERLPFAPILLRGPSVQMAVCADALVVCLRDRFADILPEDLDSAPPEGGVRGFLVRLDEDTVWLLDLRAGRAPVAATAKDDVSREPGPTSLETAPLYEGFIYTADLRRDTATIVEQVHTTVTPLLVIHRSSAAAMLVNHDLYHGQLASLDETSYSDWQERLVRAKREILAKELVSADDVLAGAMRFHRRQQTQPVRWTRQAAEDFARLDEHERRRMSFLGQVDAASWSVPMTGPFLGFRARPAVPNERVVFQIVDGEAWMAYIRTGIRLG